MLLWVAFLYFVFFIGQSCCFILFFVIGLWFMAHYVISSCVQFCWLSLVLLYWPLCPVSVLEHLTIATLSGKTNTENFLYPTLFLTNTPTILFPLMLHTELVKSTGSRSQFKDAGACIMRLGGCFSSLGFS